MSLRKLMTIMSDELLSLDGGPESKNKFNPYFSAIGRHKVGRRAVIV